MSTDKHSQSSSDREISQGNAVALDSTMQPSTRSRIQNDCSDRASVHFSNPATPISDENSSWLSSEDEDVEDSDYIPKQAINGYQIDQTNQSDLDLDRLDGDQNKRKRSELDTFVPKKRPYNCVKRIRNPRTTAAMRERWINEVTNLTDNDIKNLVCCKTLKCFFISNTEFLRNKMKLYREMSYFNRRITLSEMLCSDGSIYFDGRAVCNSFLNKAFRFSFDMITSLRNGDRKEAHKIEITSTSGPICQLSLSSDRNTEQRDAIITFLERLAENCGDKMPDTSEIHLPFFRKRDVLRSFKEEFRILYPIDVCLPSTSYFYRIWRKYAKNIKVRKLGRFAKCTICEQLREGMAEAAKNRVHKRQVLLKKQKVEHLEMIGKERRE